MWSAAEDLVVSIINTVGHPIRVICDILGKSCGSEMFVMSATACHHNPAFSGALLQSRVGNDFYVMYFPFLWSGISTDARVGLPRSLI